MLNLRVAWRILRVLRNVLNEFLQLSFEGKNCYIANLLLMGEIDPWVLLNGGFSQDSVWLQVGDFKVASS